MYENRGPTGPIPIREGPFHEFFDESRLLKFSGLSPKSLQVITSGLSSPPGLKDDEREFFADHIDKEKFADVITDLPDTLVEETMERLDAEEQREILDQVSDDDRVDILQDVHRKGARGRFFNHCSTFPMRCWE